MPTGGRVMRRRPQHPIAEGRSSGCGRDGDGACLVASGGKLGRNKYWTEVK